MFTRSLASSARVLLTLSGSDIFVSFLLDDIDNDIADTDKVAFSVSTILVSRVLGTTVYQMFLTSGVGYYCLSHVSHIGWMIT